MMETKNFFYRSQIIHYTITGKGPSLILLHGYLADSRIWKNMIPLLENNFQLIIPDLPGHGKSDCIQSVNSMEFLAESIYRLCLSRGIYTLYLGGHSMGGYAALAFASKYPEMMEGLFLINSHPFADSMTRILARNREAELIQQEKKHLLLISFAERNFFKSNIDKFQKEIQLLTQIALDQPKAGILADLAGMMAREDKNYVVEKTRYPVEIIVGTEDEKISHHLLDRIKGENVRIHFVAQCGHISIIEQSERVADLILAVLNKH